MKEYIVEFGDALYNEETGEEVFKPKIVGEIIRCKDCKHYKPTEHANECGMARWYKKWLTDFDFCSRGERKEE